MGLNWSQGLKAGANAVGQWMQYKGQQQQMELEKRRLAAQQAHRQAIIDLKETRIDLHEEQMENEKTRAENQREHESNMWDKRIMAQDRRHRQELIAGFTEAKAEALGELRQTMQYRSLESEEAKNKMERQTAQPFDVAINKLETTPIGKSFSMSEVAEESGIDTSKSGGKEGGQEASSGGGKEKGEDKPDQKPKDDPFENIEDMNLFEKAIAGSGVILDAIGEKMSEAREKGTDIITGAASAGVEAIARGESPGKAVVDQFTGTETGQALAARGRDLMGQESQVAQDEGVEGRKPATKPDAPMDRMDPTEQNEMQGVVKRGAPGDGSTDDPFTAPDEAPDAGARERPSDEVAQKIMTLDEVAAANPKDANRIRQELAKLGVHSRQQLRAKALRKGLKEEHFQALMQIFDKKA